MPKVTSKLQLTVPRAIADQYGIRPGDELQWIAAGEAIRVIPAEKINLNGQERTVKERLELFDQATERSTSESGQGSFAGSAWLEARGAVCGSFPD